VKKVDTSLRDKAALSQHAGRRKRYYRMRAAGERALANAFEMANRLQQAAERRFRFVKQRSEIRQNPATDPADALDDVGLGGKHAAFRFVH
jgi:DNA-binding PadR family transcriptional regulator